MSYQLGGYTVYVAPDRVTPLEVGTEQAMRAVLTGGSLMHGGAAPASRSGLRDPPTASGHSGPEARDSASNR